MNEYQCLKPEIKEFNQIRRGAKKKSGNECDFLYFKREDLKIEFGINTAKHYKLCSNQYFCEHKSLFPFQIKKEYCIMCGKETELLNDKKCFECELTEMANKKADEFINQEWAI